MKTQSKPLSEVNSQAIRLLSEQLGVADAFRFVHQFTIGHGNYTAERDALFRGPNLTSSIPMFSSGLRTRSRLS